MFMKFYDTIAMIWYHDICYVIYIDTYVYVYVYYVYVFVYVYVMSMYTSICIELVSP